VHGQPAVFDHRHDGPFIGARLVDLQAGRQLDAELAEPAAPHFIEHHVVPPQTLRPELQDGQDDALGEQLLGLGAVHLAAHVEHGFVPRAVARRTLRRPFASRSSTTTAPGSPRPDRRQVDLRRGHRGGHPAERQRPVRSRCRARPPWTWTV